MATPNSYHTAKSSTRSRNTSAGGEGAVPHPPTSLLQCLEDAVPAFGEPGRRLVRAIAQDYPHGLLEEPARLIRRSGASPQLLDGLAAAAGFRDFAEVRHRAQIMVDRGLRTPGARFSARLAKRPLSKSLVDRIIERETGNVASTLRSLANNGSLALAAGMLVAGRRRYIIGERKSYAYAHLLGADLQSFLPAVTVLDGLVNRPMDILVDATPRDVAVCFSVRRYSRGSVAAAAALRRAGTPAIGITDDAASPLAKLVDLPLVAEIGSESLVDSPTAIASVLHALVTITAVHARSARRRLTAREELARDLGVYSETGPLVRAFSEPRRAGSAAPATEAT